MRSKMRPLGRSRSCREQRDKEAAERAKLIEQCESVIASYLRTQDWSVLMAASKKMQRRHGVRRLQREDERASILRGYTKRSFKPAQSRYAR